MKLPQNNPLSDIFTDNTVARFLGDTPGPESPSVQQIRIVPHIGGPYLVENNGTVAVVDHNKKAVSFLKIPRKG
jgi:hypothetical protein